VPPTRSASVGPAALVAAAVLLLLLLVAPAGADATSVAFSPCARVPPADGALRAAPLLAGGVFSGAASFQGVVAARVGGPVPPGEAPPPAGSVWVFVVDRVLGGALGSRVVEVASPAALPTLSADGQHRIAAFLVGERYWVRAIRRGEADPLWWATCAAPAPPAAPERPRAEARAAGRGRESPVFRIASAYLQLVVVLGLGLTGAATYLRARKLDLEERELALRER
jgi:hypothetical protein